MGFLLLIGMPYCLPDHFYAPNSVGLFFYFSLDEYIFTIVSLSSYITSPHIDRHPTTTCIHY